ncbi:phosphoribosyltransferase [Calothrix sp. PCC 6303]|uniref:phosphoribosyltransferase n=1 Tax=Calothrix sp. PCC 6303 TaxID=1170562 RepID=UPI0002A045A9|nr:phosphoribosyltransferase family protein [Calothrix sp. PCC 6303]AFZ04173.1 phosphoribosyltransferase [Calothrix sp. PCC 6303]
MNYAPFFANRREAGEKLAEKIQAILTQEFIRCESQPPIIVYALPRGGLEVAVPIASLLGCPLTVAIAKKIGHPKNPELAIGAVTSTGHVLWMESKQLHSRHNLRWWWRGGDKNTVNSKQEACSNKLNLESATTENEAQRLLAIAQTQELANELLPFCPPVQPKGAILILVDDGIATGMTIAVAVNALRELSPSQIWICTPVAPIETVQWLQQQWEGLTTNLEQATSDKLRANHSLPQCRIIVLGTPKVFLSVSDFYLEFPQIETSEVISCLKQQNLH